MTDNFEIESNDNRIVLQVWTIQDMMDIDFFLLLYLVRVYVQVFSYQQVIAKTYFFVKQVFVLGIMSLSTKGET